MYVDALRGALLNFGVLSPLHAVPAAYWGGGGCAAKLSLFVLFSMLIRPQPIANRISCMYVCMVTHIARVWIMRVRLPILLVVS